MVRTFERWDCIDAPQREKAKEARFAACTSLLTSPATRRMPPNCGAFRFQPRASLLRQTGCWRKADSNSWSHPPQRNGNGRAPASTSIILRENALLGERLGRYKAES